MLKISGARNLFLEKARGSNVSLERPVLPCSAVTLLGLGQGMRFLQRSHWAI
jgi:hypothetical protein